MSHGPIEQLAPDREASIKFLLLAVKWPEASIRRVVDRHPDFTEDRWRRLWAEVKSRKNLRTPGGMLWKLADALADPQIAPWQLPSEQAIQPAG